VGLFFRPRRPIARLAAGGLSGARPACPAEAGLGAWAAPSWATEAPAYTPPVEAAPARAGRDETARPAE
jgi:hypothetical protein